MSTMNDTTICDRCGCEINLAEANYAGPELPFWEGATLCNECYAAERVSEPQPDDPDWGLDERPNALTLRELQKSIAWYD